MGSLDHIFSSMEPFIRDYGVLAIFVVLALESIGLPLPGESLLIFGSALAARGEMSFSGLLISAWIGGVAGDNIGYAIGRKFGRKVILQYGEKIGLNDNRLMQVEAVIRKYGPFTVMFARFFNGLRQLNGVVAGTAGMNWWKFLLCNAIGCALWVVTWGFGGRYIAEHVPKFGGLSRALGFIAAAIVVISLIVLLFKHTQRKRHHS
jgi:membrane protein DedA with SNARE-associated domain